MPWRQRAFEIVCREITPETLERLLRAVMATGTAGQAIEIKDG